MCDISNYILWIKRLKYLHLIPVALLQNSLYEFKTCVHKFKTYKSLVWWNQLTHIYG